MADQYESAHVVGTDLSPVQPEFVPANCKFEIDDASSLWTFTPNSMDLVYFRFMLGSFEDWTEIYRQAFKYFPFMFFPLLPFSSHLHLLSSKNHSSNTDKDP